MTSNGFYQSLFNASSTNFKNSTAASNFNYDAIDQEHFEPSAKRTDQVWKRAAYKDEQQ